jgi:hypothetical protein
MRTLAVRGLNVSLHNIELSYVDLFRAAYRLRRPIKVLGDQHLLIQSMQARDLHGEFILFGTLARFTKIDPDAEWFNDQSLEPATEDEKDNIEIPPHLHPNLRSYMYAFYESTHKFVFEAKGVDGGLGVQSVQTLLEKLFAHPAVLGKFGEVEVNPVWDADRVDHIFDVDTIRKVTIEISRPNPDDYPEHVERNFQEKLRRQKARKITTVLEAERGESIVPSKETLDMALVASRNGNAIVEGTDERGAREVRQLKDHPLEVAVRYDREAGNWPPFLQAIGDFFRRSRRK